MSIQEGSPAANDQPIKDLTMLNDTYLKIKKSGDTKITGGKIPVNSSVLMTLARYWNYIQFDTE